MIRHLVVRDFILIDELELPLASGFIALTGETGAGKSVLVRAVELLRGGRARADVVREGADEAVIEAIFEPPPDSDMWRRLRAAGLPEPRDAEEGLAVRRVISREGRGRVSIAGALAGTAQLAEIVAPLVDVASQHEHQSLGEVRNHLEALDAFGRHDELRAAMAAVEGDLRRAAAELAAASMEERARAEREDFVRFQIGQIDELAPEEGEDERLARERDRLRSAHRLIEAAARAHETLYAGERAAAALVIGAARELAALAAIDPRLETQARDLEQARATIEDAAFSLRRYADSLDADPERLAQIEDRLDALARLCRKHGSSVGDVLRRRAELGAELAALERHLELRREAEERVDQARARALEQAQALTAARRAASRALIARVAEALAQMQMREARFDVELLERLSRAGDPLELVFGDRRLDASGGDRVEFLIAPNRGEPARPLARIASGGELSRVMLALKLATADADQVSTYLLDEVDAGIGGAVAEAVGRLMREVSRHRQVLCVTHLPQIAACADVHLRVEKREAGGRTVLAVERLTAPRREAEIARMLAGVTVTRRARAHAAEMLARARA